MTDAKLRVGCSRWETSDALFTGAAGIEGFELQLDTAPIVLEIFAGMLRDRAYDVSELGLTFMLRSLQLEDPPVVALPIFPARIFRHSAVYVNVDSGIEQPSDLAGKTVGEFALYGQDAGLWAKGILADEYGFDPARSRWVIGGLDQPIGPLDFVPQPQPEGVEITRAPEGKALGPMLEAGEIDALFSANAPQCILEGSPRVRLLFDDSERVERDYYRRTGMFPIMHTVAARRELVEGRPGVARAIYDGFVAAKDAGLQRYREARRVQQASTMVPWMNPLFEENHRLFPEDWWPYGIEANRAEIETALRYHHEQGFSPRRLDIADVFATELLDT